MKKFPAVIHCAFEENQDGEEDYLAIYTDGIYSIDAGRRVAIYKRVDEGVVRGPKSFVSKKKKR